LSVSDIGWGPRQALDYIRNLADYQWFEEYQPVGAGQQGEADEQEQPDVTNESAVGRSQLYSFGGKQTPTTAYLERAAEELKELSSLRYPNRSLAVVKSTLAANYGTAEESWREPPPRHAEVAEELWKEYPRVDCSYIEKSFGDGAAAVKAFNRIYTEAVLDVVPRSGPGVPCNKLAGQNGKLLDEFGELIKVVVKGRWNALSKSLGEVEDADEFAVKAVENNYADPWRLHLKNEPTKVAKLDVGKARIIMGCSLIDQLIDRMSIGQFCKACVSNWETIPSMIGAGASDEDMAKIHDILWDPEKTRAHSDMSSYDYTVQDWENTQFFTGVAKAQNAGPKLTTVIDNRSKLWNHPVVCLPDGTLHTQPRPGITKSGGYPTGTINSWTRNYKARLVQNWEALTDPSLPLQKGWSRSVGDDCAETFVEGAKEKYDALGACCKHYVAYGKGSASWFELCSLRYDGGDPVGRPCNWVKALFVLLSNKPSMERFEQFAFEMRHLDEATLARIDAVLSRAGWCRDIESTNVTQEKEECPGRKGSDAKCLREGGL